MKNSADLGGCYPPRPSASVDNTLLDLQNSSYPTQPHSIIGKYLYIVHENNILQYICTFWVVFVFNRIGQLLERFAAMETDSEEKTTENEDSLG